MKTLAAKIDVEAPPDRVWEVLTDFPSYPQWNPFMFSVEGTAKAGAHLRIGMQRRGGMVLRFGARVVVADPAPRAGVDGGGSEGPLAGSCTGRPPRRDRAARQRGLAGGDAHYLHRTPGAADGLARALPRGVRRDGGGVEGPRRAEFGTTLARKQYALELFEGLPRRYDESVRRSASSRIRAGGGRWSPRSRRAGTSGSSMSRPAPGWWPGAGERCGCRWSGSTRAARCSSGRARSSVAIRRSRPESSCSRGKPSRCPSTTTSSTTSPSPICFATSTIRRRRCASSRGWSSRAGASPARVLRPAGAWLWPWRLYTRLALPALGGLASRQW